MGTDWAAVAVIVAFMVVPAVGCWWVSRWADRDMDLLRRRFATPQSEAATGTGVERGPLRDAVADLAALPRSPNSKPTPSSAKAWSSQTPTGVADPRPAAPVGLHPLRVTVHG